MSIIRNSFRFDQPLFGLSFIFLLGFSYLLLSSCNKEDNVSHPKPSDKSKQNLVKANDVGIHTEGLEATRKLIDSLVEENQLKNEDTARKKVYYEVVSVLAENADTSISYIDYQSREAGYFKRAMEYDSSDYRKDIDSLFSNYGDQYPVAVSYYEDILKVYDTFETFEGLKSGLINVRENVVNEPKAYPEIEATVNVCIESVNYWENNIHKWDWSRNKAAKAKAAASILGADAMGAVWGGATGTMFGIGVGTALGALNGATYASAEAGLITAVVNSIWD